MLAKKKMRQNAPAETIQMGITEVPGQLQQTFFPSDTINMSTFHNVRFNAITAISRENDRTLAAIEYCKIYFFFRLGLKKQNANKKT